MTGIRIQDLDPAAALAGTELVEVVQSGGSARTTAADVGNAATNSVKLTGAQTVAGAKTFSSLMSVTVGTSVGGNTAIRISPVGGALGQQSEILAAATFAAGWGGPDVTPRYSGALRYGDNGGTGARDLSWKFLVGTEVSDTPTERMRLNSRGNLSIGGTTDTPFGQTSRVTALNTGNAPCQVSVVSETGAAARSSVRLFTGSANSFVYLDLNDTAGSPVGGLNLGGGVNSFRVTYGGSEVARILPSGNWGFGGNTSPSCSIDTNGFTKLGESAPKVKQKKLTGTTGTVGNTVTVAHGVTQSKILQCDVIVNNSGGIGNIPHTGDPTTGNAYFSVFFDSTNVSVFVGAGGTQVASRPFRVLLTYEE